MTKAIIFDCFGVLTDDSWHAFRLSLPEEQGSKAHDLNRAYCAGQIDRSTFVRQVASLSDHSEQDIVDVIDKQFNKNLPLLDYIAGLKSHYKIGLLSNVASNWIRTTFLSPSEQKLFDEFVFSYEVGITKPDPGIYHLAAARLGVQIGECIMIDDINRYAEAAKQAGMQSITYQDFGQMRRELEILLANSNN